MHQNAGECFSKILAPYLFKEVASPFFSDININI